MKSIVVILVLVLMSSNSYSTSTKALFSRKLFKAMNNEIDNLVNKPVQDNPKEIENLESDVNSNNWLDESLSEQDDLQALSEAESGSGVEAIKKPKAKKPKRIKLKNLTYSQEVKKTDTIFENWLTISSADFGVTKKYPTVHESSITVDGINRRINDKFVKGKKNEIPSNKHFWFRMNSKYIYYADSKESLNTLGTIYMDNILNVRNYRDKDRVCFSIFMKDDVTYTMCAQNIPIKKKWMCGLQKMFKFRISKFCKDEKAGDEVDKPKPFRTKTVIQPMVLIPLPAKHCNENWNYVRSNIIK